MEEKILELIEELGTSKYKKGISWKGYEVYIPEYKGNPTIGLPYVVLVKGEEARISTVDESLDYLDYEQDNNLQSKSTKELSSELRYEQKQPNSYVEKKL